MACWPVGNVLRRPLVQYSDDEIDRALRAVGKDRPALFSATPGNAPHRRRMARMMARFGVTPDFAVRRHWGALRNAERLCVDCRAIGRCKSWLDWPVSKDAPRVFCPNADTFDTIAYDERHAAEREGPEERGRAKPSGSDHPV